jgi:hypothetical protein
MRYCKHDPVFCPYSQIFDDYRNVFRGQTLQLITQSCKLRKSEFHNIVLCCTYVDSCELAFYPRRGVSGIHWCRPLAVLFLSIEWEGSGQDTFERLRPDTPHTCVFACVQAAVENLFVNMRFIDAPVARFIFADDQMCDICSRN